MNRKTAAIMGLVLIAMSGCGGTTTRAMQEVEPGMTEGQVITMLGEPRKRSFNGEYKALLYDDAVGFGKCAYVTIWFKDDVVLSTNSLTRGCFGPSTPPSWDQLPESIRVSGGDVKSESPGDQSALANDKYDDLAKLKELLDDGALTQEEYDREKAKILVE